MSPTEPPTNGHRPGGAGAARPDPLTALGSRIERSERQLNRKMDELTLRVTSIGDSVLTIKKAKGGGGAGEEKPALPSWLLGQPEDPAAADKRLCDLADWLGEVYLRYPGAQLPPCWAYHPGVVEELLVLWECWKDAYSVAKSWLAVRDWHHQTRPGVVARLEAAQDCHVLDHKRGGPQDTPAPSAPMRSALPVVAAMWVTSREVPFPTADEIEQARRADGLPTL
jgi:hypothetical protein